MTTGDPAGGTPPPTPPENSRETEPQPSIETVISAQRGDRKALDRLVAGYLPLLYNIVGRAMNGHADVDDVVQETLLRVVRALPNLRDPASCRSWLVAIAIRQVRGFYSAQAMAAAGADPAETASQDSDFADLTILQLGLSGQRRGGGRRTRAGGPAAGWPRPWACRPGTRRCA